MSGNPPINILITGGGGQLGRSLLRASWPPSVRLYAPGRPDLDICRPETVARVLQERRFSAIINTAAFTSVDRAETEAAEAFAVNALGPAILADAARNMDIPLIHVSTDYIFDGTLGRPYTENDSPNPINVYGASKLAGELAVQTATPRSVILRTAWLISGLGNNFAKTMLRSDASRKRLSVVDDQFGSPTSAQDAAEALSRITMRLIRDPDAPLGVFHFVNEGGASRYELAQALFSAKGGTAPELVAISTENFPLPAQRPVDTRLDNTKIRAAFDLSPRPWLQMIPETARAAVQEDHDQ